MSKSLSRRSFLRRAAGAVAVASLPAMQVAPQIEELAIRPVEGEMEHPDLVYSPYGYIFYVGPNGKPYRIPIHEEYLATDYMEQLHA